MADLDTLRLKLRQFAEARDWQQFHTPKNLAMALIAEAGEVVEHFQWLTGDDSSALAAYRRDAVALELADVLLYLLMLADRLDVDLIKAAERKIEINEARYPAEAVRGQAS